MKCSNVVECAIPVSVLCQPVPPSSNHLLDFFLEIFQNILFLLLFKKYCTYMYIVSPAYASVVNCVMCGQQHVK